jgi:hypothetical protein
MIKCVCCSALHQIEKCNAAMERYTSAAVERWWGWSSSTVVEGQGMFFKNIAGHYRPS